MESLGDIIHDRVHNQRWFTARGLKMLADATRWSEDLLSNVIAGIMFLLLVTDSNWIVCNSVLVVVPLLITYVYPDESPPEENMRVYWISAFVATAFDRMLEAFPFYYVGKLCAFLFLLVEPSCLNEKLKKLLKVTADTKKSMELVKKEKDLETARQPVKKEKDLETARQPTSAWDRFTESLKTAIGGTSSGSSNTSRPSAGSQKAISSLISQPAGRNISTNTAIPRSRSLSGDRSAPASTLHEAKPVTSKSKTMFTAGESVGRASIATGPPVGVGEKKDVTSTYINLPKSVGKQNKASIRLEGVRRSRSNSGDSQRLKNVSVYANIPK